MFRKATYEDIGLIKDLAYKIWPAAYGSILSGEQILYMLAQIYNDSALQKQMHDGQDFIMVLSDRLTVGFASFSPVEENALVYKLHKIYLLPAVQGAGLGEKLLFHIIDTVKQKGGEVLKLNVNRHNPAREFYVKHGFVVTEEVDIPIGHGYFMNDFIMEKNLTQENVYSRR